MVALVQRVSRASVSVEGKTTGEIGNGLLILLGVHRDDTEAEAKWLAGKCANLRIFADQEGKMNRSVLDEDGDVLVVSQFTLYGDASRGNRPSFVASAPPEAGEELYERFVEAVSAILPRPAQTGVFGAMMDVDLINRGPVTLWIEKKADS